MGLKTLSESQVKTIVQNVLNPKINEITYKLEAATITTNNIAYKTTTFESTLRQMQAVINNSAGTANTALKIANNANSTANTANGTANSAKNTANYSNQETIKARGEAEVAQIKANRSISVASQADIDAKNAFSHAGTSANIANKALDEAYNAQNKAFTAERKAANSLDISRQAALDSRLAAGIANQADFKAGNAVNRSVEAVGSSKSAVVTASEAVKVSLNTSVEVSGLRGVVNGIGSRIDGLGRAIGVLEAKTATAITNAAKAVGISSEALAATGRLAGRILEIFQIIGAIATLIEQLATLNVLGGRIDAVERELQFLSASVSGILGKLLGLQNRIGRNEALIAEVKNVALDAKGIGEAAKFQAKAAQVTATRAENFAQTANNNAKQAQLTADGAVRNAAIANENATIAFQKATESQITANKATSLAGKAGNLAGTALEKGGQALGIGLTALSLIQLLRLRPGIPGLRGEKGVQGIPGKDGVVTIIQVPGVPGRDGRDGQNGLNGRNGLPGKNGVDGMNSTQEASLRALIIQQHQETRSILGGAIAGIKASITSGLASVASISSSVIGGANTALLTVINNKLGQQVTGGISGLVTSIAQNSYLDKVVNVMTFAATIHNALMLSNNLGQTLIAIINQVTGFILPKGLDGTPINFSESLGKLVHLVIADAIGEENYKTLSEDWQKANRIYQATSNVFNSISNLGAVITAGLEVVAGNVAAIGNALKKWGAVGEKAYKFMNPQPNLKGKFFEYLTIAEEKAQAIAMVVAIPIAIKEALGGINSSVADLKREIAQEDPKDEYGHPVKDKEGKVVHYKPGLEIPVPVVADTENEQAKADSTNFFELVLEDIFDGGD
ncbi:MAG: hypothetical protein V7K41_22275 [Nostoc sp.]|uniref:hypothetical protein n=1 Tax=Nostoc sp. TaxID=1180 RepID=UPI002FFCEA6D